MESNLEEGNPDIICISKLFEEDNITSTDNVYEDDGFIKLAEPKFNAKLIETEILNEGGDVIAVLRQSKTIRNLNWDVIRATPSYLIKKLEYESSDFSTHDYIDAFCLSHPIYIKDSSVLIEFLSEGFKTAKLGSAKMSNLMLILRTWMSNYYAHDFTQDGPPKEFYRYLLDNKRFKFMRQNLLKLGENSTPKFKRNRFQEMQAVNVHSNTDYKCKKYKTMNTTTAKEVVDMCIKGQKLDLQHGTLLKITFPSDSVVGVTNSSDLVIKELDKGTTNLGDILAINEILMVVEEYPEGIQTFEEMINEFPNTRRKPSNYGKILSLPEYNCTELAIQLTNHAFKLFSLIHRRDYLNWGLKLTDNIDAINNIVQLEKNTSNWVNDILNKEEITSQVRSKLIQQLIKVARFCLDFGNYNSCFLIVNSIGMAIEDKLRTQIAVSYYDMPKKYQDYYVVQRKLFCEDIAWERHRRYGRYQKIIHTEMKAGRAGIPVMQFIGEDLNNLANAGADVEANEDMKDLVNFEMYNELSREINLICNMCDNDMINPSIISEKRSVRSGLRDNLIRADETGFKMYVQRDDTNIGENLYNNAIDDVMEIYREYDLMRCSRAYLRTWNLASDFLYE